MKKLIAQSINDQKIEAEKFGDYKPAVIALNELSRVLAGQFYKNNASRFRFISACGFPN